MDAHPCIRAGPSYQVRRFSNTARKAQAFSRGAADPIRVSVRDLSNFVLVPFAGVSVVQSYKRLAETFPLARREALHESIPLRETWPLAI